MPPFAGADLKVKEGVVVSHWSKSFSDVVAIAAHTHKGLWSPSIPTPKKYMLKVSESALPKRLRECPTVVVP
jgi:hypothetical protein